ncbi:hypothetical protein IW261DRAFT_1323241, partial [Armillaria novae-zelandiae]
KRKDCKCTCCTHDRSHKGCDNPHKCAITARIMLDRLTEKWDPRRPDQEDGLAMTLNEHIQNLEARANDGTIRFNPDMDSDCSLVDGFRIFASVWDTCSRQAERNTKGNEWIDEGAKVSTAYTDGSAFNNGTATARAGAGVWFGDDDERNLAIRLSDPLQTNNIAEIRAV